MGSCVSVHKNPESSVKLPFPVESKSEKVLIPSPVKERTDSGNAGDRTVADAARKSQLSPARFVHAGSKDEAFFDSQPWLESDCEDDFLSVNGDFTPSRGNTPVHHSFSAGNQRADNARVVGQPVGSAPEQSPPDKKKRLSELFKESVLNNEYADVETAAGNQHEATSLTQRPKSTNGTPPYLSRTSSERTPNGELEEEEEEDKPLKAGQCCLPGLVSSRSFSERKKRMSPTEKVG